MDLVTRDFSLTYEDGRSVRGVLTRPADDERRPGVLVVHGFKGFLRWGFFPDLQERLALAGLCSVAFNLSGSGVGEDLENFTDDEGFLTSTPSQDVLDVACVRTFLERNDLGVDTERLALLGHSRGGGTVLLQASEDPGVRAVCVWAPVSRTLRFPEEAVARWRAADVLEIPNARTGQVHRLGIGWLEDAEEHADALDILAACQRLEVPTLVVHGAADESVPLAEGEAVTEALGDAGELCVIEGAGHTFGAIHPYQGATPQLEEAIERTLDFLGRHLS